MGDEDKDDYVNLYIFVGDLTIVLPHMRNWLMFKPTLGIKIGDNLEMYEVKIDMDKWPRLSV